VGPEPLALEVALAHYVASMPEGKEVPIEDLATEFGCSVGDIEGALQSVIEVEDRDLTTISGVTIEDGRLIKHLSGGYERGFRRPVRLSPVQGRAALLALDLVSGAADPGILHRLREKVREAVGEEVPEVASGGRGRTDSAVSEAIEHARSEKRVLEIRYPSGDEVKARPIEPALMSNIEGAWYLNAHCRYADDARLFRLDRILSARVLDEHFEERPDMEMKTRFEDIDPRRYAAKKAVIRFSSAIARWMEERPELDLVEEHPGGSADYILHYTDEAWAAKRVMQYLGEAVVVEPEELREEVRRRAEELLARHRGRG
jgi:proteasome accessory factor C